MVTDEKGDTAGVIINIGRKMVAEVLKWNDLRINGVKCIYHKILKIQKWLQKCFVVWCK